MELCEAECQKHTQESLIRALFTILHFTQFFTKDGYQDTLSDCQEVIMTSNTTNACNAVLLLQLDTLRCVCVYT